jgi:hypothetical protein
VFEFLGFLFLDSYVRYATSFGIAREQSKGCCNGEEDFRFPMLRRGEFFERGVEYGRKKKQSDQRQHHQHIALVVIVGRAGDDRTRGRPPEIEGVVLERVPPT